MTRRDFLQVTGQATAVGAALRARNVALAQDLASAEEAGSGLQTAIYNAREYGVRGDGMTDDSDAIEALFRRANKERGKSITYFFPAGTYLISRPCYTAIGNMKDRVNYGYHVIGQGPTQTRFTLKQGAKGFEDPQSPKIVLGPERGRFRDECFAQIYEGFAVFANNDNGNPGSVAMAMKMHFGMSRDLILAGGYACLVDMAYVIMAVENITCLGGKYGIMTTRATTCYSQVHCKDFTEAGVWVRGTSAVPNFSGLYTEGKGPALRAELAPACVVGGRFRANPEGQDAAVIDTTGGVSLVNVTTSGYNYLVKPDAVKAAQGKRSTVTFYAGPNRRVDKKVEAPQ